MARVYLGLGSNVSPVDNLSSALEVLAGRFELLSLSSVFESESIGFKGDNFFNLVVGVATSLTLEDLSAQLKSVEDAHGRDRHSGKFSGRTLDVDILTYDDYAGVFGGVELPRGEISYNAFVLWPLSEVAGSELHPVTGCSYQQMWAEYCGGQHLWPVEFVWRGCNLSSAHSADIN